jgi:hypothetical protein
MMVISYLFQTSDRSGVFQVSARDISSTEYASITLAIRRFDNPLSTDRNIKYVEKDLSLTFGNRSSGMIVKGKQIRELMANCLRPNDLHPLRQ